jgi:ATP-binding cassette subfamily B protein
MIPPRLIKFLVDEVVNRPATAAFVSNDTRTLWLVYLVAALFGVQVLTAIGNSINGRLSSRVGTEITNDLRNALFAKLTQLSVDYYDRHSVGHLISRMGNDTDAMRDFVRQATQGFLAQILMVIVTGAMLFSISWKLALWTLLPAPLVVTVGSQSRPYGAPNPSLSGSRGSGTTPTGCQPALKGWAMIWVNQ